jgi:hypothetical protein
MELLSVEMPLSKRDSTATEPQNLDQNADVKKENPMNNKMMLGAALFLSAIALFAQTPADDTNKAPSSTMEECMKSGRTHQECLNAEKPKEEKPAKENSMQKCMKEGKSKEQCMKEHRESCQCMHKEEKPGKKQKEKSREKPKQKTKEKPAKSEHNH